jgi:hypothetical protein
MDAQNKWSEARKVMKEVGIGRVSSKEVVTARGRKRESDAMSVGRGNALGAILRIGMKRMLKVVVEVQYTTATLEVAG